MKLINRGSKQSPIARQACEIALATHQKRYGDYGRSNDGDAPAACATGPGELINTEKWPGMGHWRKTMDDILLTSDLTSRYKISRKTLWSWQSVDTMPRGFISPFPQPDFPGNPNRWRAESVKEWEGRKRIN
ncbi:Uncharacterised protein [Kluyvera cryocrescens]|uniref:Uncharacterized protein n=1 Tax=Kluyvera cryocrescens TaxID=580 RepID=A0A485BPX6_KLUCR|nr:Uncharacterised protein [Kluyvera cryocrescens]